MKSSKNLTLSSLLLLLPVLPLSAQDAVFHDYETTSGFVPGDLAGQQGWRVEQGSALISDVQSYSGSQAVALQGGSPFAQISFAPGSAGGAQEYFVDFRIRAVAGLAQEALVETSGVLLGLFVLEGEGSEAEVFVFDGQSWQGTGYRMGLDAEGLCVDWTRVTVHVRVSSAGEGSGDVYLDGELSMQGVPLLLDAGELSLGFVMFGDEGRESYLDDFATGVGNPLGGGAEEQLASDVVDPTEEPPVQAGSGHAEAGSISGSLILSQSTGIGGLTP